jgi:hypothetical protein
MPKARKWRKTPYYKVQAYNDVMKAWQDTGKVFDTTEEAKNYIATELAAGEARILVVERNRRYVLES